MTKLTLEQQLLKLIYECVDAETDWQDVQQIQDHLRKGLANLEVADVQSR